MKELDKQEEHTSDDMRYSYFDHPSVDVLERFVLHRSSEEEVELIETHVLACESCVCALENLELEIAATKLALEQIAAEQPQRTFELEPRKRRFWKSWLSVAKLSWAAAGLATCALCLFAVVPAKIELKADRGIARVVVPEWRNAHVKFIDEGLPAGPLRAEIVNETGTVVWSGDAQGQPGALNLQLPRIMNAGHYYARLYTAGADHELLSEFPFEVKFQF
jgi:hypothetical protein